MINIIIIMQSCVIAGNIQDHDEMGNQYTSVFADDARTSWHSRFNLRIRDAHTKLNR